MIAVLLFPVLAERFRGTAFRDVSECQRDAGSGVQLVTGADPLTGRSFLDIVPATAGPARALRYLAEQYSLPLSRVFFAGDSGDDLDVLLSGVSGVLVGNAGSDVRNEACRLTAGRKGARLYAAQGYYGDGVAEGLRHYGFWPTRY